MVASMQDSRPSYSTALAILTGMPVPEKVTLGAEQPIVVEGLHDRSPFFLASDIGSRRNEGKCIVKVNNVGTDVAHHLPKTFVVFLRPNRPEGQFRELEERWVTQYVCFNSKTSHSMAVLFEQVSLRLEYLVFATPVEVRVVYKQHARLSSQYPILLSTPAA